MADDPEDLNYDCNYNMFLAKTMLPNLVAQQDRQLVLRWLRKLAMSNRTLDEMKLRNDFMYHLVLNVQSGELLPPFNENPPVGPLPVLAQLLPGAADMMRSEPQERCTTCWARDLDKSSPHRPMLYRHSPDGGSFLAAQPLPKCGAFAYLAVVAKPKHDQNRQE